MSFNVIELFHEFAIDMSRFRKGKFKSGLISHEAIDEAEETNDKKRASKNVSYFSSFHAIENKDIEQLDLIPSNFRFVRLDIYTRNASVVTYTLEHGEKINKKI